jgi:hypothetical protein
LTDLARACFYNALAFSIDLGGYIFVTKQYFLFWGSNYYSLRPDYPSKVFPDKRINYVLLMESLAADPR